MMLLGALLLLLPVFSTQDQRFGYAECTYNPYKAVCVGRSIRRHECQNCLLTEFPAIRGDENCVLLRGNRIKTFPKRLTEIAQVRTLDLAANKIAFLPDDLHVMSNLQILDVSKNLIRVLSPSTRFPESLRGLLVAGNRMTTIPSDVYVPGLFVFDLSDNEFTEIPEHFCVSEQLIRVDMTLNPLKHDMSHYVDRLSGCRNVNDVPYCIFAENNNFTCNCRSLAPVFGYESPSFCMGPVLRNHYMECTDESSAIFKREELYHINTDLEQVRSTCKFVATTGARGTGTNLKTDVTLMALMLKLIVVCLPTLGGI